MSSAAAASSRKPTSPSSKPSSKKPSATTPPPLSLPLIWAILLINIWAIGRDPIAWPDEILSFRPDRFLPGGRHEWADVKGKDFELIPFGGRRSICAGMNLGMRMVQFMEATLVHSFDWRLPEGERPEKLDMDLSFGLTLHQTVPLMVRPVSRLEPEAYL